MGSESGVQSQGLATDEETLTKSRTGGKKEE